jgi:SPP1 gp7 family putative phage head morphogenesis protein
MPDLSFTPLPFDEAIRFFRGKVTLPADQYRQLTSEARAKAFSVSGVARMDVMGDIYESMERAISEGRGYGDWKNDIRDIMQTRGWDGKLPYRADTIFRTNIQSSYQAGHYQRMMEVADALPYWQYVAVMDGRTRPAHAAMNGKVLPANDPWWQANYPPNGFNCRCTVRAMSERQLQRDGLIVAKNPLPVADDERWAVNAGDVAWRDTAAARAVAAAVKEDWLPLISAGRAAAARPAEVPYGHMPPLTATLKELRGDEEALRGIYRAEIGGRSSWVETPDGDGIVLSDYLFDHLSLDGREAYFPLLRPTLEDPYEIWLMPQKGERSGRIVFRKRFVKFFQDAQKRHVMLVGEYQDGCFVGYTFFRGSNPAYFDKFRAGWLVYGQ